MTGNGINSTMEGGKVNPAPEGSYFMESWSEERRERVLKTCLEGDESKFDEVNSIDEIIFRSWNHSGCC